MKLTTLNGLTLLLAEPCARLRRVERMILERLGCRSVSEAPDPDALHQMIQTSRFDLVLMAAEFGPGGAMDFLNQWRISQSNEARQAVLVLLSSASTQSVSDALLAGADGCLVKPLRPETLASHILELVARPAGGQTPAIGWSRREWRQG